jgi:hypothetical protein
MVLLGDVGQVVARFGSSRDSVGSVRLEIVLISALDGCTVCAECTTGMEIILDTPDGTPR